MGCFGLEYIPLFAIDLLEVVASWNKNQCSDSDVQVTGYSWRAERHLNLLCSKQLLASPFECL